MSVRGIILALALSLCLPILAEESDPALDAPAETTTAKPAPPAAESPPPPQTAPVPPEEVPPQGPATASPETEEQLRTVRISTGAFLFDYTEELPQTPYQLKSTERRVIPAIDLTFLRGTPDWFLRGTFQLAVGPTDYDGTDQVGNPLSAETENTFINTEIDLGLILYRFPDYGTVGAYLGLGMHYWRRELVSYLEQYSWLYVPIGVDYVLALDKQWTVGVDFALKFPCFGRISANLSEVSPSFSDGEGLLGTTRTGVRLQVPVSYAPDPAERYSIVVTPWFEYSALSTGSYFPYTFQPQVGLAHEPPSHAYRYGVWVGAELRM